MHPIKKTIAHLLTSICILACSTVHGLPIDKIHKQGEYLKSLIYQANVEQFKRDSAIFFEFDPQFPPSGQQMVEYKKVAKALYDYAVMVRVEKFEERKLLLGKRIHNRKAFALAAALGLITGVGLGGSCAALLSYLTRGRRYPQDGILALFGYGLTGLCAYSTRYYYRRAINTIDTINQQMRDLWTIIEHTKQLNAQLNANTEPRA